MTERLSLATSTGLPFLALAFHFATGFIAMLAGFVAVAVRKGGVWHRRSGVVFVYGMIATGITATGISIYEGKLLNTGGAIIVYLIVTAWTAVKPIAGIGRRTTVGLMLLALACSAVNYLGGFTALGRPGYQINGVPAGMMFFLGTIMLLAALGDVRMIRAGSIAGTRRLARHLWRMCFALFIASGSFLLGQMKFIPEPVRIVPVIFVVALSPLGILLYWMWRVRLRRNLRGMMMSGGPAEPAATPAMRSLETA